MNTYHSIFNDVLGPIMNGPSSSHSAGCSRIGKTAALLFGRDVTRADVVFEEKGSYPSTYIGQGSDFGFTGGLMGMDSDDPNLKNSVETAKLTGRKICFKKDDLGFSHPNMARIDIFNENEEVELSIMTYSVGGGMFLIDNMDGFKVNINGCEDQMFILCGEEMAERETEEFLKSRRKEFSMEKIGCKTLYTLKDSHVLPNEELLFVRAVKGIEYVRLAKAIMPVKIKAGQSTVFYNADEAMRYHLKTGKELWEMAIDYECGFGSVSAGKVVSLAEKTLAAMRNSAKPPDYDNMRNYGFLPFSYGRMNSNIRKNIIADTGLLQSAMFAAIATMENSCSHNIVAAAPTAGSSGVLPAAVVCLGEQMGITDEAILKGLLAAGAVGVFIANQATFGGEVGACQAENGSASAMAAAGIVQMLGGTVEQAFNAASIALQNMLGLICDPIGGLTEIPCVSRNVMAVGNAVLSANMAVLGFDPIVPLDEVIISMFEVGKLLPSQLRCTCEGGLCATPTGRKIEKELAKKRKSL